MDLNQLRKILFESGIKSIDNIHVNKLTKKYILNFLNDDKYDKRNIELNSNSNSKFNTKGGAYTGAICIKNSFRQHAGECWHDAISMLYIFSDDIKEQVQKKLEDSIINDVPKEHQDTNEYYDINDIVSMGNGREQFKPLQLIKSNENRYYKLIKTYLFNIQKRFSSHYKEETIEPDFKNKRSNDEKIEKRRLMRGISEEASIKSCINLKLLLNTINSTLCQNETFYLFQRKSISDTNRHGGGIDDYTIVINIINQYLLKDSYLTLSNFIFGCNDMIKELYTQNQLKTLISENVDNLKLLFGVGNKLRPNHATSLFKCDGKYYYYDDNYINACVVDNANIISVFTENNISNKFIVEYTAIVTAAGNRKLNSIKFLSVGAGESIISANERTYDTHDTIDYLYIHNISFLKNNINDISSATTSTYKFMLLQLDLMCINKLYELFSVYQTEKDISNYTPYDINHVCMDSSSDHRINTNNKDGYEFIKEIYNKSIDIKTDYVKIKKSHVNYDFNMTFFESSLFVFYKNISGLINDDLKNNLLINIANNSSSIYDFYNLLIVYLYAINDIPSQNDKIGMEMLLNKFGTEIPAIINEKLTTLKLK